MAEITLLRHGQASFGADNYDQLSELGLQQARWLGEHLRSLGKGFDAVIMGSMVRHRQTAEAFSQGYGGNHDYSVDPGLNEYSFQGLLTPLRQQHPELYLESGNPRKDYNDNLKQALAHWMSGQISTDGSDSWHSFQQRVESVFQRICQSPAKRTLVVTSGGPISVVLAAVLGLDHQRIREINMQIRNTSTSRILHNRKSFALDSFNDVSHLQQADKHTAITFT
ncbi:MAG: histidine phosphatase family protein [Gammaproteobacteria bacterium]|nr:histidine phosphatase family protein [Gammaproteobacteria bacterium]